MGRLSAASIVFVLGAAAALGLVACGSDADLLPGDTASEINANLDQVEQLAGEGDCIGAADAAEAVSLQVEELGGVDAKLKGALREGAARLNEVVAGCEEETVEETAPAIEEAEEPEAEEEKKKPKPEKPEPKEKEEPEETTTPPTLPPQAEGKAKGHEKQEEAPPVEPEGGTPSGGVGPGAPAGGE